MIATDQTTSATNTSHKVVLPFYLYSAISFLAATVLLFFSTDAFNGHHFHPKLLAITHLMALGWGTMMILGASHQLVPVLIESPLYSNVLAHISFYCAAVGIPLLVWSFLEFHLNGWAIAGGVLINLAVLTYLMNIFLSISKSRAENVHAVFVITAAAWLFFTTLSGLLLLLNFTIDLLSEDSLYFLSLHAHFGIAGWFLLLILGVGTRLIPMFLISKYSNTRLLWIIFWLVNGGLILFIILFFLKTANIYYLFPVGSVLSAVILFAIYCKRAYDLRIRRSVDGQMKVSLISIVMLLLPLLILVLSLTLLVFDSDDKQLILAYGFSVFFGWITAIILGMTFKTLPFIIWNKVYHLQVGIAKTPSPKELFSNKLFTSMSFLYVAGFLSFLAGILLSKEYLMQAGTLMLLTSAVLYNSNIFRLVFHKPLHHERSNEQ